MSLILPAGLPGEATASEGGSMADLHDMLASYVADGSLPGAVAVLAGGDRTEVAVVGSAAVGGAPMTRDAIFRFASITKPITAAAVMMLVEDGRIALDDPVAPEVQDRDAGQRNRRYRLRACAGRDESGNVTDRAVTMSHPSGWVGSPLPGSALTSVNELTSFTNALHNLNGKRC